MGDDLTVDPARLAEPELRGLVARLFNLVEELQAALTRLIEG